MTPNAQFSTLGMGKDGRKPIRMNMAWITMIFLVFSFFLLTPRIAMAATCNFTITVNTFADDYTDNGNCSLREAITAINTHAPRDACPFTQTTWDNTYCIALSAGTYTITRDGKYENGNATGDFDITRGDVSLIGSYQGMTIINGADRDRVFHVATPHEEHVTFERLIIRDGGIDVPDAGGGIYIGHTYDTGMKNRVTIEKCVITSNNAGYGGGIAANYADVYIYNSTISENNAYYNLWVNGGGYGGGLFGVPSNPPDLTRSFADFIVHSSTIVRNFADYGCSGVRSDRRYGSITLANSILAMNTMGMYGDHPDLCGHTGSVDHSFIGRTRNDAWYNSGYGSWIAMPADLCNQAVSGNICSSDMSVTLNPELGTLADNGGNTLTCAYTTSQQVHHAGTCSWTDPSYYTHRYLYDQRNITRGSQCSMGAFELSVGNGASCSDNDGCDSNTCMDGRCCTANCAYDMGGSCGSSGQCVCDTGWTGATCNVCQEGYYGNQCQYVCACEHGDCDDGLTGNGSCECDAHWTGTLCDQCVEGYYGETCDQTICGDGIQVGDEQCESIDGILGECCDADTCRFKASGTVCGDAGTECTNQDTCDGLGVCTDNGFQSAQTACGDAGTECTNQDTCDGLGVCTDNGFQPAQTACGDAGTECINQDTCDGLGTCTDNGFQPAQTACGDAGTECTNQDTCDGLGVCTDNGFQPAQTACGDAGTECINQDTCDGLGTCTDNGFQPAQTACGDEGTECVNQDTCDGLGTCTDNGFQPAQTVCGDAGTECVNQDTCDGMGSCTDNGFKPVQTACGEAPTECSGQDTCDGSGTCQPNDLDAGTACGDAGTECVNQDTCDGSGSCTDNGFKPAQTACGDATENDCNHADTCDGAGLCLENLEALGTNCGEAETLCSGQDTCDDAGICQPNDLADTTACDDSEACTHSDHCDGAGACTGTAYTCDADVCDASSACDGQGGCESTPAEDGLYCDEDQQGDERCYDGECLSISDGETCDRPIRLTLDEPQSLTLSGLLDTFTPDETCSDESLTGPEMFFDAELTSGAYMLSVTPDAGVDVALLLMTDCHPAACSGSVNEAGVGEAEHYEIEIPASEKNSVFLLGVHAASPDTAGGFEILLERVQDEDGDIDGDIDGDEDGDTDGDEDGDTDGDEDGDTDGDEDGDIDGDEDGDMDGDEDDDDDVTDDDDDVTDDDDDVTDDDDDVTDDDDDVTDDDDDVTDDDDDVTDDDDDVTDDDDDVTDDDDDNDIFNDDDDDSVQPDDDGDDDFVGQDDVSGSGSSGGCRSIDTGAALAALLMLFAGVALRRKGWNLK